MTAHRDLLITAHRNNKLFPACKAALEVFFTQPNRDYTAIATYAQLCNLTEGPCIDRDEDVDAIIRARLDGSAIAALNTMGG